jgi:hypothetical protein
MPSRFSFPSVQECEIMLRRFLSFAALFAAITFTLRADDAATAAKATLADGNYLLSYGSSASFQQRVGLLMIETKDGKSTVTLETTGQRGIQGIEAKAITVVGDQVTITLNYGAPTDLKFVGTLNAKTPGKVLGTFGDADRPMRGYLETTKLEKLAKADMFYAPPPNESQKAITDLRAESGKLSVKMRQEKDAVEKKKLAAEIEEITKKNAPKIREINLKLASENDLVQATMAAEQLLATAKKDKATEAEVTAWAKIVEAEITPFGPQLLAATKTRLGTMLVDQENYGKLALSYLGDVSKTKDMPKKNLVNVLKTLARAQTQAGLSAEAKATGEQITKIDAELDTEYLATVPPFKPKAFEGRKDKSANKVVVMELFTGAQCPPCVAADVGFDGLIKTYKPQDVIFLQYHEHIPGPDPLTNPDAVARMSFYRDLNKNDFGGTPSCAFNGKPAAGGGGGMANSESKYKQFMTVIDEALETSTDIKLGGNAKQAGDDLTINVEVSGLKEAKDLKLRLVLVEENIKYVGGNGLRFHHHVVRSLLGTQEGVKISGLKEGKYSTKQNLVALKSDLTKYLNDYAEKTRPFPYADRPLDFKGLKVVALVQDDETGEVLQATQFDLH